MLWWKSRRDSTTTGHATNAASESVSIQQSINQAKRAAGRQDQRPPSDSVDAAPNNTENDKPSAQQGRGMRSRRRVSDSATCNKITTAHTHRRYPCRTCGRLSRKRLCVSVRGLFDCVCAARVWYSVSSLRSPHGTPLAASLPQQCETIMSSGCLAVLPAGVGTREYACHDIHKRT
jgi:hypothetical protein